MPHIDRDRFEERELEPITGRLRGSRTATIAAVLAALLGGATLTVELIDNDGDRVPDGARVIVQKPAPPPSVPTVATVDNDADGRIDDRLDVKPAAADRLEDELEAGQAELAEPLREANDTPATTRVPGPLAADEVPGCRTRFVGNSSSRNGQRPRIIVLHQTVSRERGWSSQNALTAMAARRSSGVSWHLLIGRSNGLCTYTVPLALKAWTQGNANPFAIGIEVEAYGNEGAYVVGAGKRRLVDVARHLGRRYGIPPRRGIVRNCQVVRSGYLEHEDLGACGGGHIDVTLTPGDAASYVAGLVRSSSSGPACRRGYTASECRWLAEYDRLKRTGSNVARRRVLRRVMTAQRQAVWRAAQPRPRGDGRGWSYSARRARYRSLRARTT